MLQSWLNVGLVDGAYPNRIISLQDLGKDAIANLLKEHHKGKHGPLVEEVKVCVLIFQGVLPGMSPYFVLIGRPQTTNEMSTFATDGKLSRSITFII